MMTTHSQDAPASVSTIRILVVENDPQTRSDHVFNLNRWGYQVFAAEGEGPALLDHARQLARQARCQLALVDMRLLSDDDRFDISGLELAPDLQPTKSIVVTGFADKPFYARLAQDKDVLAIYGKEEGPAELRKAIQDALAKFGDPYPEQEVLAEYKTSHPWRIIVVDDNKREREYYVDLLRDLGYQVAEASHDNAKEQAHDQRSHLAIVDLDNNTDALTVIEKLKPAEVLIIGSAMLDPQTWRSAEEKNVIGRFDKKEGAEKLGEVIKSVLNRCGYRDTLTVGWPPQLDHATIAHHLFPENPSQFAEETKDVLRRLFRDADTLSLEDLTGPAGHIPSLTLRPHSMILRITRDNNPLSLFTKISRKDRTGDEGKNFRRIRDSFGHPSLITLREEPVTFWTLGGVVYDYVGNFINYTPIIFREFYLSNEDPKVICKAIKAFRRFWGPLYSRTLYDKQGNVKYEQLLIAYDQVWGGQKKWRSKVLNYRNAQLQEKPQSMGIAKTIEYPTPFDLLGLPDPVAWLIEKVQLANEDLTLGSSKTPRVRLALTHGDLHADNFFVFRTPRLEVSAIDFERAGEGPVLQDLIELEHDISTRLVIIQPGNLGGWQAFGRFACEIVRPLGGDTINRSRRRWPGRVDHQEEDKALSVIKTIRTLAREIDDSQDIAEQYAWGLLLNTIFRMMIWWEDYLEAINAIGRDPKGENLQRKDAYHAGIQRCMVLAGMLCHRIDHWNEEWPPKTWEAFLREPLLPEGQGRSGQPSEHAPKPTLYLQCTDLSNPEHDFRVRILNSPNKQPNAMSRQPYASVELVAIMKLLERAQFTPSNFNDPTQIAALQGLGFLTDNVLVEDWVDRVGCHLFDALVPTHGGVREEFRKVLYAQRDGGILQLDFDKESTILACYPWELLHDGFPTDPRATVDVVRCIASDRPARDLIVPEKPCRLIYVSARPNNLTQPRPDRDVIKDQISELDSSGVFKFEELNQRTHHALKTRLINTGKPAVHVLHFDGHGMFARRCPACQEYCQPHALVCKCGGSLASVHPRGYLAFETDSGKADYVDSKTLLEGIPQSQIRLVVLSSCHSARVRGADLLLAGVGPGLILGGVPAVVAMQFSISDKDARAFFDEFYKAVLQGNSLPDAVSRGRVVLPEPAKWSPVLYLRSQDNQMYLCPKM